MVTLLGLIQNNMEDIRKQILKELLPTGFTKQTLIHEAIDKTLERVKEFVLGLKFYHPLKEGGEVCPEENVDRREIIKFLK